MSSAHRSRSRAASWSWLAHSRATARRSVPRSSRRSRRSSGSRRSRSTCSSWRGPGRPDLRRKPGSTSMPSALQAIDSIRRAGELDGVAVSLHGEAVTVGDAGALARAVTNLVDNAVRHAGHDVTVTVGAAERGFRGRGARRRSRLPGGRRRSLGRALHTRRPRRGPRAGHRRRDRRGARWPARAVERRRRRARRHRADSSSPL